MPAVPSVMAPDTRLPLVVVNRFIVSYLYRSTKCSGRFGPGYTDSFSDSGYPPPPCRFGQDGKRRFLFLLCVTDRCA